MYTKIAKWLTRRWDDVRPHFTWAILTLIIAAVGACVRRFDAASVAVFVLVCLFLGAIVYERQRKKRGWGRIMIVYLPILIGLAFCAWAFVIGQKVFQMSDDVRHLQAQAIRFVLPREITPQQESTIAQYLAGQPAQNARIEVVSRDDEADSYRADIQTALQKGGWAITAVDNADNIPEGLSIDVRQPADHQGSDPGDIFVTAFEKAGIQIPSRSGGSGESQITILVGRRKRDKNAVVTSAYMEQRRKQKTMPPLSDDNF